MSHRLMDRLRNFFKGPDRPNWCSIHHCEYNAQVFKDCPKCLAQEGPYYHDEQRNSEKAQDSDNSTQNNADR